VNVAQGPKIDAAFYGYAIADLSPALDECVVANIAIGSHDSAFNDMGKGPDPCALANQRPLFNGRQGMNQ
jgi:hypothetical protein